MRPVAQRFRETFTHQGGWQFNATLQPIRDMKLYADDYFPVRQILRIFYDPGVKAGDIIIEKSGQRYLLGELDLRQGLYTSFRVYPLNQKVMWSREVEVIDSLTGEPRGNGKQNLGEIWIASEIISREARGSHVLVKEEVKRVLTGSAVKLNDFLGNERVVKANPALGIQMLEVV